MKKQFVISHSNLPTKLPVFHTITLLMAIEFWKTPEWLKGIVYFILVICWILCICALTIQTQVDISDTLKEK